MNPSLALVIAPPLALAENWCSMSPAAAEQKETALADSALIGKVTTKAENDVAGRALAMLQQLSRDLENERKKMTDPYVEAQRMVKRMVDTFRDEIDREAARVAELMKGFAREEQRRIREEQEAQQRELERIERERLEALRKTQTDQEAQAVMEHADQQARIAAKPVEITRARGQSNRKKWRITQINDFLLVKSRPDLVRRIEWDMAEIKRILDEGGKLPGVTAEEDMTISVRQRSGRAIDV